MLDLKIVKQELGQQLAERVDYIMEAQSLTNLGLSQKSDISRSEIIKIRNGLGGQIGISTLFYLADALGVSPEWLAYGETND